MDNDTLEKIIPNSPRDRIFGMIYGHALGDAVGLTTEFKFKCDNHVCVFPYTKSFRGFPVCDWTDDTDHLILVMQSLTENFDKNKFLIDQLDFAKKLKNWVATGFKELGDTSGLGLGITTNMVINNAKFLENPCIAADEIWQQSGKKLAPNGSLMRTSILGVISDVKLGENAAVDLCKITHSDPRCIAACVLQTYILHSIIYNSAKTPEDISTILMNGVVIARKYINNIEPVIFENFRHQPLPDAYHDKTFKTSDDEFSYWIQTAFTRNISELKLDEMVKIGFVLKCLGCSIYALQVIKTALSVNKSPSFKKFIMKIAGECGNADTNCAVSGAIIGSFIGYTNLPTDWLAALPNKKWLDLLIIKFINTLKISDL